MTVDPFNITKYDRTEEELQEFLFFCATVPGHNAKTTSQALDKFLQGFPPFKYVREITSGPPDKKPKESLPVYALRVAWAWRKLIRALEKAGIGCKTRVSRSMWELAYSGLNLQTCSVEDLEKVYGVGPKSARFFIVHSRKDPGPLAILDVHVLRYLRSLGHDVPDATPATKKQYQKLEKLFVEEANKSGKTLAEFDLSVWKAGALGGWER